MVTLPLPLVDIALMFAILQNPSRLLRREWFAQVLVVEYLKTGCLIHMVLRVCVCGGNICVWDVAKHLLNTVGKR